MTSLGPAGGSSGLRATRAQLLVIGSDPGIRALSAKARRLGAQVLEVPLVADGIVVAAHAPVREPVGGVIVSVRAVDFDLETVVRAIEVNSPGLPVHAAYPNDDASLDPQLVAHGFEESVELPPSDAALLAILRDCGVVAAAERPPAPAGGIVEIEVERARERASERTARPAPPVSTDRTGDTRSAPVGRPDAPTRVGSRDPRPGDRTPGDADLADAIAAGGAVEPIALALIRAHHGSDDVRLSMEARPAERAAVAGERARIGLHAAEVRPVGTGQATPSFGELLSATVSSERLAPWAAWLGSWLRLEERHRELARLAHTDELTGAGNRRAFQEAFAAAVEEAKPARRTLSLMYFDLDDFKRYNDEHGHETGDEVLRETVELLRSVIRQGDQIFRFGGDEFVVLFCDGSPPRRANGQETARGAPESIEAIADRFRRALATLSLPQLGAQGPGAISVSGGVSVYPWDGHGAEELLRIAEANARRSKAAGKNVVTFGPTPRGEGDDPSFPAAD